MKSIKSFASKGLAALSALMLSIALIPTAALAGDGDISTDITPQPVTITISGTPVPVSYKQDDSNWIQILDGSQATAVFTPSAVGSIYFLVGDPDATQPVRLDVNSMSGFDMFGTAGEPNVFEAKYTGAVSSLDFSIRSNADMGGVDWDQVTDKGDAKVYKDVTYYPVYSYFCPHYRQSQLITMGPDTSKYGFLAQQEPLQLYVSTGSYRINAHIPSSAKNVALLGPGSFSDYAGPWVGDENHYQFTLTANGPVTLICRCDECIDAIGTEDAVSVALPEGMTLQDILTTEDATVGSISMSMGEATANLASMDAMVEGDRIAAVDLNLTATTKVSTGESLVTATKPITELATPVTVTVPVEGGVDSSQSYVVVRDHDGEKAVLDATVTADESAISFQTDRFSTFSIYTDKSKVNSGSTTNEGETAVGSKTEGKVDSNPTVLAATGDSSIPFALGATALLAAFVLTVAFLRSRKASKR